MSEASWNEEYLDDLEVEKRDKSAEPVIAKQASESPRKSVSPVRIEAIGKRKSMGDRRSKNRQGALIKVKTNDYLKLKCQDFDNPFVGSSTSKR